jgi:L-threonylcarbamoyladenylate synthase
VIPFRTPEEVAAAIPAAVMHLSRRGIIAYPTETIYGLGSSVSAAAVDRLSALKGRPAGKPFLLLVSAREMVAKVGLRLTDAGERLAAAFWPGPLTLVVPGGEHTIPDPLRGPEGGVAVRWTSHPGAARIVSVLGAPITSTSANRPRQEPAAEGSEVGAIFPDEVTAGMLLILDAGRLQASLPSTVIDCTGAVPRLVREGAVRASALRAVVPSLADVA